MEPTNFNTETDNSPGSGGLKNNPLERKRKKKNTQKKNALASCGLKNTLHGNVFQLKLLMLFLIRGISAGYQFKLGTEMPGVGGKFEDLIFKFKDETTSNEEQTKSYRFLQAKHTQNEETEKITATDLLKDNDGDFSLPKYFRSYFRDIIQGSKGCLAENVHDCIICTNIGFDNEDNLRKEGIELIRLDDHNKILSFDKLSADKRLPARYKLKKTVKLRLMMTGWSEVHLLAKTLLDYATGNQKLTLICDVFKSYHVALVDENVIDRESGKLCTTFLEGDGRFHEILSELTFIHYWEKLSFKYENKTTKKKDTQVGSSKKLTQFEGISIEKLLPKYSTTMGLDLRIFEDYYADLISENIIDAERPTTNKKPFTKEFIRGINLTQEGSQFRKKLCDIVFNHYWKDLTLQISKTFGRKQSNTLENKSLNYSVTDKEIDGFLDKLVFAVHTPNEVELDNILKSEVGKYYELHENDFQSDFILRNMLDWFKKKESTFMTSEEGTNIFKEGEKKMKSLRMTGISIDYQKQLKKVLEFNEEAIEEMKETLERLLTSPNRIGRITTPLPKRTAVKVIAALDKFKSEHPTTKILGEYFQCKDSYLVTSLSNLRNKFKSFKVSLQSEISHHLLIVVGDVDFTIEDGRLLQDMIPSSDSLKLKKIILVIVDVNKNPVSSTSHRERDHNNSDDDESSNKEQQDEMKFSYLSEKTKSGLMSLKILFQGQSQTVADLTGKQEDNMLDNVFDCFAIEELLNLAEEKLNEEKSIKIPSYDTSRSEQSLYIERNLRFPFDGQFEFSGKCRISPEGHIKWLVENEELKKEAWKEVTGLINQANSTNKIVKDNDLTNLKEKRKEKSTVIISGVAGSGKSTILSHYYEKLKRTKSDHWIIRINLVDRCEELMKVNHFTRSDVINCCINHLHVVNEKSSFSRSLLRNRLEKGDRIIFMFDGFDEINSSCQEKAIELMKAITKETAAQLFVTTRPHMADDLQFQLSQLAYNLENFTEQNQTDYLVSYWIKELNLSNNKNELLQQFAKSLVERMSETLKDEENSFVVVPLQCRILAECYHSNVKELIKTLNSKANGEELHGSEEHLKDKVSSKETKLLSNQKFDIISLYELLIKTKRKVFREEKANATSPNHIVSDAIDRLINDVEDHLTKLAITLFVKDKDKVHILWPPHPHQSKEKKRKEKKANKKYGYAFGLTTTDKEGKETFLHRTYAEYYFAKFLFEGFKLDEKKHNKLLENETTRNFIMEHIFTEQRVEWKHYHGVRVFLDFMLVDTTEEWCKRVENQRQNPDKNTFPLTLKKLNESLKTNSYSDLNNLANFFKMYPNLKKFLGSCILFQYYLKSHEMKPPGNVNSVSDTTQQIWSGLPLSQHDIEKILRDAYERTRNA